MNPKINFDIPFTERECKRCHNKYSAENFTKANSVFFVEGYTDICNDCLKVYLQKNNFSWDAVDKLCQYLNIPFIPNEFEKLHKQFGENCFPRYADFFHEVEYEHLEWKDYYDEFCKLRESGYIADELPLLSDKRKDELRKKWGGCYDEEDLYALEQLYQGLLQTQNISGALQMDQAMKICKISIELDSKMRAGDDIDKLMAAYDKLIKNAEFTPKNVKNASDFDSIGELVKWLEKRGFKNTYFDGITKDVVDETMANIQAYNRRLYTNEAGIGEQISERIEGLKNAEKIDSYSIFEEMTAEELDDYDNDGYMGLTENEEFTVDLGE